MKPTHIHVPTGKPCRIVSLHLSDTVLQLDMGDYPNPFPRVDACDVRPMNSHELKAQGWDKRSDAVLLAQSKELDEAYASETGPAEAYDRDVLHMYHAARALMKTFEGEKWGTTTARGKALATLGEALDQYAPWLEEQNNDPRSMGWVNDKGLP